MTKNAGKGLQPVLAVVARRGKGRQAAAKKASEGAGANARTAGFDKSDSSVIYLGHIPPAFEEREMRNFFAQFGEVQRLKLYRSQKTNRPKGYAFVEFESSDVARTVSDVMNGYFLQERQLRSNVVPAGNHMGKMLGVVARFAQLKVLFVHELVQLFERKTVVLAGENPSTELMIFLLFTTKVETE